MLVIQRIFFLLFILLFSAAATASELETIVEQQRKMIVLLDGTDNIDPTSAPIYAARNHYVEKLEAIQAIIDRTNTQSHSRTGSLSPESISLLQFIENTSSLHSADLLAFLDLADELLEIEKQRNVRAEELSKLQHLNENVEKVLDAYGEEYSALMSKFRPRGKQEFESWQSYLNHIKSLYKYEELLTQAMQGEAKIFRDSMRGSALAKDKKDQTDPEKAHVLWGNTLPENTVVLTFDDGPHHSRTPEILDILKAYKVNGYFFSVGRNMGSIKKDGTVKAGKNKELIERIVKEGHVLANHTFSHPVLTKLNAEMQKKELAETNSIIKAVSGKPGKVFRPPYGSQNDTLEDQVKALGLISVMWNVDSMDWADPIPESIADRVLRQLDEHKKGILLFHDIHKQTIKALPDILAGLHKRGVKVVTLDGSTFADNKSGIPDLPETASKEQPLYSNSWAVVIGINQYQHWPELKYAVNDAKSVAETLHNKLGFPKENIIELYDEDASRERITEMLGYELADQKKIKPEDRVFVFYAGHGMTRDLPGGGNLGYIIPVDAEMSKFQNNAISMSLLSDFSSLIPAKHLYFVMDSCYSGLALTRAGMTIGQSTNYLNQVTQRKARQILTAGGADQQVADNGPGGHSVFTWTLLQGLEGMADTDNNGYVTASELGTYVAPVVSSYSEQTPSFGNLVGSKGGDFVFKVDSAAVAAINKKVTDETARIEAELDALRNNTQAKVRRRLELELALEKVRATGVNPAEAKSADSQSVSDDRIQQARRLNASALQYFKEKKYKKAKAEWEEAVRLNPYNPTIVNNYAFVLDQLDENDDALKWYFRTVELDAKRISVYLNLGDIMMELDRPVDAIPYYERYLHLYPSYSKAKELREKLKTLKEG